jgi:predicted transcriptional regulator
VPRPENLDSRWGKTQGRVKVLRISENCEHSPAPGNQSGLAEQICNQRKRPKQIVRVLAAIENGSRTSAEISEYCGLPLKHCSAYLGELVLCGVVTIAGKAARRYKAGAQPLFYEIAAKRLSQEVLEFK